jgi:antibiotic biosynthesis monooxygenase (ABM) superfamily enzyme
MGSLAKYLYIVAMDVDPDKETRFNEWYSEEHVPALLKVPGVLGAYRYVSLEGGPKYIAIYELDNPSVRASEAWKKAVEMTRRPKDIASENTSRTVLERIYPKE